MDSESHSSHRAFHQSTQRHKAVGSKAHADRDRVYTSAQSPLSYNETSTQSPLWYNETSAQSPLWYSETSAQSPLWYSETSAQSPLWYNAWGELSHLLLLGKRTLTSRWSCYLEAIGADDDLRVAGVAARIHLDHL